MPLVLATIVLGAVASGCTGGDDGGGAELAGTGTAGTQASAPLRRDAPILGLSRSDDGTSLTLYVVSLDRSLGPGDLVATQERAADGVHLQVLQRGDRSAGGAAAAEGQLVCTIAHDVHVIRVPLDAPLGDAPVIDRSTGVRLTPIAESAVLRPSTLPAGWVLLEEQPLREGDAQTGWVQRYGTSDAAPSMSVVQRLASLGPNERFAVDRVHTTEVVVRGAVATWSRQGNWNATSLVWQEGGFEVALSSSSPDGVQPALDRQAMETFAAGLAPRRAG